MLIREEAGGIVAIGQASHAWLSGQMARAWGGENFDRPEPHEEVCLAAEQHDVGMAEWDLAPPLRPGTGRPQSFMEMALEDHLALWSRAPRKLVTQSSYAALLVSMHGTALYERRDAARMSTADAAAVRGYLGRERDWQRAQLTRLGADWERLRRNQRLLWAWDGLSLAVCLRWPVHVAEAVPARGDETATLRLMPEEDADVERFGLEPWPFSAGEVLLRCEGRRLAGHYENADAMREALARSAPVALHFRLTPSSR